MAKKYVQLSDGSYIGGELSESEAAHINSLTVLRASDQELTEAMTTFDRYNRMPIVEIVDDAPVSGGFLSWLRGK